MYQINFSGVNCNLSSDSAIRITYLTYFDPTNYSRKNLVSNGNFSSFSSNVVLTNGYFNAYNNTTNYNYINSWLTTGTPSGTVYIVSIVSNTLTIPSYYNSKYCAIIKKDGSISQTINFDNIGTYVLSFYYFSRSSNDMNITINDANNKKNLNEKITPIASENWVYKYYEFTINNIGNYNLMFQGTEYNIKSTIVTEFSTAITDIQILYYYKKP